jgi:hypothetical protein
MESVVAFTSEEIIPFGVRGKRNLVWARGDVAGLCILVISFEALLVVLRERDILGPGKLQHCSSGCVGVRCEVPALAVSGGGGCCSGSLVVVAKPVVLFGCYTGWTIVFVVITQSNAGGLGRYLAYGVLGCAKQPRGSSGDCRAGDLEGYGAPEPGNLFRFERAGGLLFAKDVPCNGHEDVCAA